MMLGSTIVGQLLEMVSLSLSLSGSKGVYLLLPKTCYQLKDLEAQPWKSGSHVDS